MASHRWSTHTLVFFLMIMGRSCSLQPDIRQWTKMIVWCLGLNEDEKNSLLVVLPRMSTIGTNSLRAPEDLWQTEQLLLELMTIQVALLVLQAKNVKTDCHELSSHNRVQQPAAVLLIVEDRPQDAVGEALIALTNCSWWNARAPHLVAVFSTNNILPPITFLQKLLEYDVTRAAVIQVFFKEFNLVSNDVIKQKHTNVSIGLELIWGQPFSVDRPCGAYVEKSLRRFRIREIDVQRRAKEFGIFRQEMLPNLGLCELKAAVIAWGAFSIEKTTPEHLRKNESYFSDGLDVRIIKMFAERMNFSVSYYPTDHLIWTSAATYTINGLTEFTNSMWPTAEAFKLVDATVSYWQEVGRWYMPPPARIPHWMSVLVVFSKELWLALWFSVAAMTFSQVAFRKILRAPSGVGLKPLYVLLVLLGSTVPHQLRHTSVRLSFISWVCCCLVVNTAYQSALMSFLANPGRYPHITSLDALLNTGLIFNLVPDWKNLLSEADDPRYKVVMERSQDCDNISLCVDDVINKKAAMPFESSYIDYHIGDLYYQDKHELIDALPGTIASYHAVIYLKKHSKLLPGFNFVIQSLVEGGLHLKWMQDITHQHVAAARASVTTTHTLPMAVAHLQGAFLLLGLGLTAASVALALEMTFRSVSATCPAPQLTLLCTKREQH